VHAILSQRNCENLLKLQQQGKQLFDIFFSINLFFIAVINP